MRHLTSVMFCWTMFLNFEVDMEPFWSKCLDMRCLTLSWLFHRMCCITYCTWNALTPIENIIWVEQRHFPITLSSAIFVLFAGYAGRNAFNFHPVTPEFNLSDPDFYRHHRNIIWAIAMQFVYIFFKILKLLFQFSPTQVCYQKFLIWICFKWRFLPSFYCST